MRRKRIRIRRGSRKIGFLGKGMSVPSHEKSEVAHALSLRIDEELVRVGDTERDRCREDVKVTPSLFRRFYSKRPDAVVYPNSGQCVAEILDVCIEEKTPAVPRGLGTSGLGGAMPVRGGVVIDLSGLCGILEVDKAEARVRVEGGCRWHALEDQLSREGLSLCAYPSSAAYSTVAGWVSTGGYGIGTLAQGNFHTQVDSMEVAVPSGILVSAGRDDGRYSIRSFAGTEGQLGVVTSIRIPVKRMPEARVCCLVHLDDEAGCSLMAAISQMEEAPHAVKLAGREQARVLSEAWGLPPRDSGMLVVAEEGSSGRTRRFRSALKDLLSGQRMEMEEVRDPGAVWRVYFSQMRKSEEQSLCLAGEVLIGVDRLHHLLRQLPRKTGTGGELLYECNLVERGKALLSVTYFEDLDGAGLVRDVPMTARTIDVALRAGGVPYGVGLWNSHYSRLVHGDYLGALKVIKNETDRLKILNPGKFFAMTTNAGIPVPGPLHRIGIRLARGT